jgi:hypothetical protein
MNLSPITGDQNTVTVSFFDTVVNLKFAGFDTEIDMDAYTSIDYGNIYSELITISPLINRVGIWRAEAEAQHDDWKLECNIYEAQIGEMLRKSLAGETSTGNIKYPSDERVKQNVLLDEGVKLKRKRLYRLKKEYQYMDSFYWALKEKGGKLNRISESMNLSETEFENNIIEGKINGYIIKKKKR